MLNFSRFSHESWEKSWWLLKFHNSWNLHKVWTWTFVCELFRVINFNSSFCENSFISKKINDSKILMRLPCWPVPSRLLPDTSSPSNRSDLPPRYGKFLFIFVVSLLSLERQNKKIWGGGLLVLNYARHAHWCIHFSARSEGGSVGKYTQTLNWWSGGCGGEWEGRRYHKLR